MFCKKKDNVVELIKGKELEGVMRKVIVLMGKDVGWWEWDVVDIGGL